MSRLVRDVSESEFEDIVLLFVNGREAGRLVGAQDKTQVSTLIDSVAGARR